MDPLPSPAARILSRLKARLDGVVSGADLASELSMTRTAVWKHIQALIARGYVIQSQPRVGYRLLSTPDLLLPEEVLPRLRTTWLAQTYLHHMETGSTNQDALALATKGAPHGTVVVAEHQTAGRGRLRRKWESPKGLGIYVSMLFTHPLASNRAAQCPLVVALSLARVLHSHFGLRAAIKWPNDILIRGRKVAGILAEMQLDQDEVRHLVVGVGINVRQSPADLHGSFRYPPTSLAIELQRPVSRTEVLGVFLNEVEHDFDRFAQEGFGIYLEEFESLSALIGKEVTVHSGKESLVGTVRGFTKEGALRLLPADSPSERLIWVGDVARLTGDLLL